ncbi:hypothetical protein HK098_007674 [Nowakowskiella sp. JEL0407]|nr:hypothetical protein HK098_007674 [Nowakowskiella sp. JEL0407]
MPDLTGKVALVTGGNTGLGYETVKQLALKHAKVYMASRTPERAQQAIETLKKEIPNAQIEFFQLNLADMKQVKSAASAYVASGERLDILINNAGIMACPFEITKDGYESQFATNHLGHFVLTTTLLPAIEKSAPSRIVNVSSDLHSSGPKEGILFDKLNDESVMTPWERYGQSKLANILFTKSLAARLGDKQVYVNSIHPGVVRTELMRGPTAVADANPSITSTLLKNVVLPVFRAFLLSPEKGALTQLYAATSEEVVSNNYRGQYFAPFGKLSKYSSLADDKELQEKLWAFSEKVANDISN